MYEFYHEADSDKHIGSYSIENSW